MTSMSLLNSIFCFLASKHVHTISHVHGYTSPKSYLMHARDFHMSFKRHDLKPEWKALASENHMERLPEPEV